MTIVTTIIIIIIITTIIIIIIACKQVADIHCRLALAVWVCPG